MDHILKKCSCNRPGCPICDWGAGICELCGAAEIELKEDCAARQAKKEKTDELKKDAFTLQNLEDIKIDTGMEGGFVSYRISGVADLTSPLSRVIEWLQLGAKISVVIGDKKKRLKLEDE